MKFTLLGLVFFAFGYTSTAQVTCSFSANVVTGCPPLSVTFTDASTGTGPGCTYLTDPDLGGTNPSSNPNPNFTFVTPGIYNVKHVVTCGSASDSCVIQIRVFDPPHPQFVSADNRGCINPCHTVHFSNQSTPGSATIVEYVWDYGDGNLPQSVVPPVINAQHCYDSTGAYRVTLIARDANGCQTSNVKPNYVVIGTFPTVTSTAAPTQTCNSPVTVAFNASATSTNGSTNCAWYFGDGGTSAQCNIPHTYLTGGIYNAILIVTDTLGCQDSAFHQIAVTDVNADFAVPNVHACRNLPLQFSDSSDFATSWQWSFGDGFNSNLKNPSHTYTVNGTYTISLIARYGACADTIVRTSYIDVTDPILFTAGIVGNDSTSCDAPFNVAFQLTPQGVPSGYIWDFGDGSPTSGLQAPSHVYDTTGTFIVNVSVISPGGCVNTQPLATRINVGVLHATFSVDSDKGCSPLVVTFTNGSTSNVAITGYQWDFGDGFTSTQANPVHAFNITGQYVPRLIVQDATGCLDTFYYPGLVEVGNTLTPNFTASPLVQCVNQTITFTNLTQGAVGSTRWLWQFGDGETSTLRNPVHEYSDTGIYNITLTVINQGCSADTVRFQYIRIIVPRADFKYKLDCTAPTTLEVTDSSAGADTWFWDFGDNTTFTGQSPPVHTYAQEGTYVVKLIVSNFTTGCVDSIKRTIPVGTPAALFSSDTTQGCGPLRITFADSSAFATGWHWDFGVAGSTLDTSNVKNPVFTYPDTGRYTVTLIINPGSLCPDTITRVNYITVFGVTAVLTIAPTLGCSPLPVSFRSDSSRAFMGTVIRWRWTFGDGDTSILPNPNHTYTAAPPGAQYPVRLTVTDNHGCQSTRGFNSVRVVNPEASFYADTIKCPGEAVTFTNTTAGVQRVVWNFGDNTPLVTTTTGSPKHVYTNPGKYTVTVVVTHTASQCTDTLVKVEYISIDTPMVDLSADATFKPCPPFPVQFTNKSNRLDLNWVWFFGDGDTSSFTNPLHVYFYPGDYDVTLVGWNASGCSDTITYVDLIRVRGPIGNFIASTDSGCVPLTISITGTVSSTVSIVAALGDGEVVNNTIDITHTYDEPGTYYPVYTLTDSLGCQVPYKIDTFVVGVIPYPNLPPDTTVCRGNYIQFDLPGYTDHAFWEADQSPKYLSCDTCPSTLCTAPDTIVYYVSASTNIGCAARDTIVVNVDALPQIFPGVGFRICHQDTLQLHAGPNVTEATWTPNLFINDTTSPDPKVYPPDSMIYRVTGFNKTGCSISRIVRVWVIDSVKADIGFGDTLLCEGGTIQLRVNVREASFNDTSFFWAPQQHLSSAIIPDPLFSAPHGDYNYTVVVSSKNCVPDTERVHIVVAPQPSVEAGDDQTVAVGTEIQLWAASPNPVNYFWTTGGDSFSCTNCRRPYVTVTQDQVVYAQAINEWGCQAIDSVTLKVVSCDPNSVFIPNTFTPNNDDLNDRLYVRGIGLRKLDYFRIFDRWGKMVFETKNINEGWDGTYNGRKADIATYVYLMKGICSSGVSMEMSGNVTLLR